MERTGSLRQAAMNLGMAYTKALKILTHAEENLGHSLLDRAAGGRSGGGSHLTREGKELMDRYEDYRRACKEANEGIYREIFGDL